MADAIRKPNRAVTAVVGLRRDTRATVLSTYRLTVTVTRSTVSNLQRCPVAGGTPSGALSRIQIVTGEVSTSTQVRAVLSFKLRAT